MLKTLGGLIVYVMICFVAVIAIAHNMEPAKKPSEPDVLDKHLEDGLKNMRENSLKVR